MHRHPVDGAGHVASSGYRGGGGGRGGAGYWRGLRGAMLSPRVAAPWAKARRSSGGRDAGAALQRYPELRVQQVTPRLDDVTRSAPQLVAQEYGTAGTYEDEALPRGTISQSAAPVDCILSPLQYQEAYAKSWNGDVYQTSKLPRWSNAHSQDNRLRKEPPRPLRVRRPEAYKSENFSGTLSSADVRSMPAHSRTYPDTVAFPDHRAAATSSRRPEPYPLDRVGLTVTERRSSKRALESEESGSVSGKRVNRNPTAESGPEAASAAISTAELPENDEVDIFGDMSASEGEEPPERPGITDSVRGERRNASALMDSRDPSSSDHLGASLSLFSSQTVGEKSRIDLDIKISTSNAKKIAAPPPPPPPAAVEDTLSALERGQVRNDLPQSRATSRDPRTVPFPKYVPCGNGAWSVRNNLERCAAPWRETGIVEIMDEDEVPLWPGQRLERSTLTQLAPPVPRTAQEPPMKPVRQAQPAQPVQPVQEWRHILPFSPSPAESAASTAAGRSSTHEMANAMGMATPHMTQQVQSSPNGAANLPKVALTPRFERLPGRMEKEIGRRTWNRSLQPKRPAYKDPAAPKREKTAAIPSGSGGHAAAGPKKVHFSAAPVYERVIPKGHEHRAFQYGEVMNDIDRYRYFTTRDDVYGPAFAGDRYPANAPMDEWDYPDPPPETQRAIKREMALYLASQHAKMGITDALKDPNVRAYGPACYVYGGPSIGWANRLWDEAERHQVPRQERIKEFPSRQVMRRSEFERFGD